MKRSNTLGLLQGVSFCTVQDILSLQLVATEFVYSYGGTLLQIYASSNSQRKHIRPATNTWGASWHVFHAMEVPLAASNHLHSRPDHNELRLAQLVMKAPRHSFRASVPHAHKSLICQGGYWLLLGSAVVWGGLSAGPRPAHLQAAQGI